ncbi:PREDICTED: LOW QUALITY PROTEIN: zinc finger protein castor homolog 1 [Myotis davidii]|uniref:LOW QUALITY PROTEIN: zinc finger protein castor homolog 1 n=1 Tax=Myotis davidii TaxID=225400 RepID=UPI000767B94F|nr:PREDICTED: LOW QUALITY PROTEIN: zinc finger protein castor homolog 1 [Myotis davidii]
MGELSPAQLSLGGVQTCAGQSQDRVGDLWLRGLGAEPQPRLLRWVAVPDLRPLSPASAAEGTRCPDPPTGKPAMAAKRKGGLKLNAICAKLSRQVVVEKGAEAGAHTEGSPLRPPDKERSGPEPGVARAPRSEEDKRRAVIEKWVNGEYSEEPAPAPLLGRTAREGLELPPEGVYMVQPRGCSDEEDHGEEPKDGAAQKDADRAASKDSGGPSAKQPSGEASSLRDYAASTMTEFLGMFGYDDQNTRDELARKISFEKLHAGSAPEVATSSALPAGEDALSKRARFSKYEEYIRKLKAGEHLSWPAHGTKRGILPLPSHSSVPMQGLVARASKYDFFIQKLKTGENLRPQNGSTYKKPSKYDLENVKYLHLFKPGEGSPDMGGAIAFKTGKVGRPSKYDVRAIQKPGPAKVPPAPSLAPAPLASVPSAPSAAGPGPEPAASLPFNTPEYLKSTFSKTDSITTGTVSTVKNGLPTDKPAVTEDVNIYQKYIARFSGSQHCGHIHCAYQYREHYHCLDPECNYQPRWPCPGRLARGPLTAIRPLQVGCNKVYTSTSDVMTHENFHKKNTQLINDGFQRFRATEDCGTADCQFYGQKTTHFHCRRPGCTFTFKNKCDIEKHKSYHIKDDAYAKDGFKKFYKYEECKYEGCVYSKATNHFHCIRAGCGFTFTSTSQMTSHKRKHERRHIRSSTLGASGAGDSAPAATAAASASVSVPPASIMERISASKGLISPMMARLAAAALKPSATFDPGNGQQASPARFPPAPVTQEPGENAGAPGSHEASQDRSVDLTVKEPSNESNGHAVPGNSSLLSSLMNKMSQGNPNLGSLLNIKTEAEGSPNVEALPFLGKAAKALVQEKLPEPWKLYLRRFGTKDFCDAQCDFLHKAHFHCVVEECGALFSTLDGAIKHANFHFRTEGGAAKGNAETSFPASAAETKPSLAPSSPPAPPVTTATVSSLEGPTPSLAAVPSAPTLLAWKQLASTIPQMPQIPTSVPHLPTSPLATTSLENAKPQVKPGFLQFQENDPCLATDCKYANKFHFHCLFGNCKYVCKTSGKAESHCLDHINPNNNLVNVRDQFAYYSLQCLCPNQHCEFRMRGHYHCLRTGCYFVTNITTKLPWHIKKHEKAERRAANGFKYFTKREECGRLGCKYNQVNSHFHCIREGCQFSFLLKHQMTSHARKHMRRMLGKNFDRVPASQVRVQPAGRPPPTQGATLGATRGLAHPISSQPSFPPVTATPTPVKSDVPLVQDAAGGQKRFWIIEDMSPFGKRRKTASSRKMLDEGMMLEGFRRFDLYEDCKDAACQFSLKVTHYHCTRENCGYKFCGRTHMYKHAQHHDRVDNLVLDDFKRFKASLSCHFTDCPFSGTSTHFHCLRCRFRCTDSTKVTAHRKHHGKQDVISAAGFCQFSSSADCAVPDCKYKLKCSHFHCTYPGCRHTVVGMSQMDSHKRLGS